MYEQIGATLLTAAVLAHTRSWIKKRTHCTHTYAWGTMAMGAHLLADLPFSTAKSWPIKWVNYFVYLPMKISLSCIYSLF